MEPETHFRQHRQGSASEPKNLWLAQRRRIFFGLKRNSSFCSCHFVIGAGEELWIAVRPEIFSRRWARVFLLSVSTTRCANYSARLYAYPGG